MTTEKINARQFWILFFFTSVLLIVYGLFEGRAFIFGPAVLETGDFASNGLRISDAGHFNDLVGNYSRWRFNHPGPFFFYLYSFGERLFFSLLGIVNSPHQAHVIAGTIFQSLCISLAICGFAQLTRRRLTLYICLACAAFIFPRTLGALTSIWPPHVLLGPYILLIFSCAALSVGHRNWLPVAVFVVCALCHGHVAQPLMTLPMLFIAIAVYFLSARSHGETTFSAIRTLRTPLWVSMSIIVIFLAPLLIDLMKCPDCNVHRILWYMRNNHDQTPQIGQAFNYIYSYLYFDHAYFGWLDDHSAVHILTRRVKLGLALTFLLLALPRVLKSKIDLSQYQALRAVALFTLVALILSLIWAKRITGPLYEFNAFFIYAIVFVGASAILTAFALVLHGEKQVATASVFVLISMIAIILKGPALPVFSSPYVLATQNGDVGDKANLPVTALINQDASEDWPATTALALWLTRHNVDFMVPSEWAYVFGWEHSLDADRVLQLNSRYEIWEPHDDLAMLNKHVFRLSGFCHISDLSPLPALTARPMVLDGARSKCAITTIGFGSTHMGAWAWTKGHFVALQFLGGHTEHPVELNLDVVPFLMAPKLTKQTIQANVNGSVVGRVELTGAQVVSFVVPPSIWNASKVVSLTLMLPDAASPASVGMSADPRILGLGFRGMGIQYDDADLRAISQAYPSSRP